MGNKCDLEPQCQRSKSWGKQLVKLISNPKFDTVNLISYSKPDLQQAGTRSHWMCKYIEETLHLLLNRVLHLGITAISIAKMTAS